MANIIYIPEMAQRLGRTEAAIRSALQEGRDTVPRYFKIGRRVCWTEEIYQAWLNKQIEKSDISQRKAKA